MVVRVSSGCEGSDGGVVAGTIVEVVAARPDADVVEYTVRESATEGRTMIRLAAAQMTVATAAHELAHALAGPTRTRSGVPAAYLDVVAVITNIDPSDRRRELHVDQLAAAFAAVGLPVGGRRGRHRRGDDHGNRSVSAPTRSDRSVA